jgi:tetratricopeptide (TPR) repeat protein
MTIRSVLKTLLPPAERFLLWVAPAVFLVSAGRAADTWVEVKCPHFTVESNAGDKEARKICDQFELFRVTFHNAFSSLRTDPGQALTIIAAKNENTMQEFLPEEYQDKVHIHHAGLYQSGLEKHYVVLRLNMEGERPYHTLYHEYTHALLHLNFAELPLWLDEGLAEYLGNASLGHQEVRIGLIDSSHLYILQQNKRLPIETLLAVDHSSPYYNEQNRASVFYAESWALVHYLLLDPEARQKGLLSKFLAAWTVSSDQIAAARQTFGDLEKFGQVIDRYTSRGNFYNGIVKPPTDALDKDYPVRVLSPAEVLALRGDFLVHHNRGDGAKQPLEEALKLDPNLTLAHEAMGMYYYRQHDAESADDQMKEAIRLGSPSFIPRYMHGYLLTQNAMPDESAHTEAIDALTTATKMNPHFAPAFDALASALDRSTQTRPQAIAAEITAVKLEPSTRAYAVHLVYLFLNADRINEAKIMANRIAGTAQTPMEKESAAHLQQMVDERTAWSAQHKSSGQNLGFSSNGAATSGYPPSTDPSAERDQDDGPTPVTLSRRPMAVDGVILSSVCSGKQNATLTLELSERPMSFHAVDLRTIQISASGSAAGLETANCAEWKGHRAKVWFRVTPGMEYQGEILRLAFF